MQLPDDLITIHEAATLISNLLKKKITPIILIRWKAKGHITFYRANGKCISLAEVRERFEPKTR